MQDNKNPNLEKKEALSQKTIETEAILNTLNSYKNNFLSASQLKEQLKKLFNKS